MAWRLQQHRIAIGNPPGMQRSSVGPEQLHRLPELEDVMSRNMDAEVVRREAAGHWLGILERLAPEVAGAAKKPGRSRIGCPVHGGSDGFRFFKDAAEKGGGVCNTCGAKPDGFALLMWLKGWSFPEALEEVASVCGLTPEDNHRRREPAPVRTAPKIVDHSEEDERRRQRLRRLWQEARPVENPMVALPAWAYLNRRGLKSSLLFGEASVRIHSSVPYYDDDYKLVGRFPALLFLITDRQGRPVTIHRIYLTPEGVKAPVEEPKKMMGYASDREVSGGAIRIGEPVNGVLGVAEGIETAMAARLGSGMTVWSTINSTLLAKFEPPEGVRLVVVWADLDKSKAGEGAALTLKHRLEPRGITVQILMPILPIPDGKKGVDWADIWVRFGAEGFRSAELMREVA